MAKSFKNRKTALNQFSPEGYSKIRWKNLVRFLHGEMVNQGLSQLELAEKIGISQPNLSRFFKAEICPRLDTFLSVSDGLNIQITPKVLKGIINYMRIKEEREKRNR